MALDELGLDLLDGVHRHAHDDQERGAAEVEVESKPCVKNRGRIASSDGPMNGMRWTLKPLGRNSGRSATKVRYSGADDRQPREDRVDVLGRLLARPDARDEAAVLPHVVGHVGRVEDDRRVEVAEEDDPDDVQEDVQRLPLRRASSPRFFIQSAPEKLDEVAGSCMIEIAKIIGMTPPVLTRSGR